MEHNTISTETPLVRQHASGEIFTAENLDMARGMCPVLGKLSLEEAGLLLELETMGNSILSEKGKESADKEISKSDPEIKSAHSDDSKKIEKTLTVEAQTSLPRATESTEMTQSDQTDRVNQVLRAHEDQDLKLFLDEQTEQLEQSEVITPESTLSEKLIPEQDQEPAVTESVEDIQDKVEIETPAGAESNDLFIKSIPEPVEKFENGIETTNMPEEPGLTEDSAEVSDIENYIVQPEDEDITDSPFVEQLESTEIELPLEVGEVEVDPEIKTMAFDIEQKITESLAELSVEENERVIKMIDEIVSYINISPLVEQKTTQESSEIVQLNEEQLIEALDNLLIEIGLEYSDDEVEKFARVLFGMKNTIDNSQYRYVPLVNRALSDLGTHEGLQQFITAVRQVNNQFKPLHVNLGKFVLLTYENVRNWLQTPVAA